jgi:hypothetical protein
LLWRWREDLQLLFRLGAPFDPSLNVMDRVRERIGRIHKLDQIGLVQFIRVEAADRVKEILGERKKAGEMVETESNQ